MKDSILVKDTIINTQEIYIEPIDTKLKNEVKDSTFIEPTTNYFFIFMQLILFLLLILLMINLFKKIYNSKKK